MVQPKAELSPFFVTVPLFSPYLTEKPAAEEHVITPVDNQRTFLVKARSSTYVNLDARAFSSGLVAVSA